MILCLALCACGRLHLQTPDLTVPAFTAYGVPNRDELDVSENGIRNWGDGREAIEWHGLLSKGDLKASLSLSLPSGETSKLRLTVDGKSKDLSVTGRAGAKLTVDFGEFSIRKEGYSTIRLQGLHKTGATFGDIDSLHLTGQALESSHFNLVERRNNASVHLGYPLAPGLQAEWFYNEVTPKLDPLYTYYEVCGFARGYFGIQVNSPTERRVIFSVWDSGSGDDPSKVKPENRTRLLATGDGVVASAFGNEGTGGHSHMIFPWVVGKTYRFLVGAKVDGDATIYSGYFFNPNLNKWTLIASFRAPKDGRLLRGLYSFDENFGGSTGDQERLAEFKNGWLGFADGHWEPILRARFTHDKTGTADRLDYEAGSVGDRFFLRTGGFLNRPKTTLGAEILRSKGGAQPKDLNLPTVVGPSTRPSAQRSEVGTTTFENVRSKLLQDR